MSRISLLKCGLTVRPCDCTEFSKKLTYLSVFIHIMFFHSLFQLPRLMFNNTLTVSNDTMCYFKVTCAKSVRITIANETYLLAAGKSLDRFPAPFPSRNVIVEYHELGLQLVFTDLGMRIFWDRG